MSMEEVAEGAPFYSNDEINIKIEALGLGLGELVPNYQERINKALEFAHQWQLKYGAMTQPVPEDVQEAVVLARNVALNSRVYIGSIIFDLTRDDIQRVFEAFGYVKSIEMSFDPATNKHKGYCFVEYEAPEAATLAINQMNGALLGGRPLKVGRPANYLSNALPPAPPERIYVANVFINVSEKDIKEVFEAFGKITRCILVPEPVTQKHKGYGYVEYETAESASIASEAMKGFDLGGKKLMVCKAMCGIPLPAGMDQMPNLSSSSAVAAIKSVQASIPNATPQAIAAAASNIIKPRVEDSLTQEENVTITGDKRWEIMQKLARENVSRTVVLKNMIGIDEIDENLEGDVKEECEKFGEIKSVVIHPDFSQGTVKVFVYFASAHSAIQAVKFLNARWFGGRKVVAEQYDDARFESRDYTG